MKCSGFLRLLAGSLFLLQTMFQAGFATAQTWPDKPVKLVVSAPAGTAPDIVGRVLAEQLGKEWKQPVIVDNKPGSGGRIAMEFAKSAPADGYTLILVNSGAVLVTPKMFKAADYDPVNDFSQLGHVADSPMVIVSNPSLAKNSLSYMIAKARVDSENVRLGSTEQATLPYLLGKRLAQFTGGKFTHIPFANPAQGIQAVIQGELEYYIDGVAPLLPLIKEGRVKVVAIATDRSYPGFESYPLLKDVVPNFVATGWFALMGPKGLDKTLATRINKDLNKALAEPDVNRRLRELAIFPAAKTQFESTMFIKSEIVKWNSVIRAARIEAQ